MLIRKKKNEGAKVDTNLLHEASPNIRNIFDGLLEGDAGNDRMESKRTLRKKLMRLGQGIGMLLV
jgi:hypothetical protein